MSIHDCDDMEKNWDAFRDGDLSAEERERCETHLLNCGKCDAVWRSEARWLAALAEDPQAAESDVAGFAQGVMTNWERPKRGDLLRKIGRFAAVAAAVAIGVPLLMRQDHKPTGAVQSAAVTPEVKPVATPADPAGELVAGLSRRIEEPMSVTTTIRETAAKLTLDRLVAMLDESRPDHAAGNR